MSREEKIEFIRNSRFFSYAYATLHSFTDNQLDEIILEIATRLQMDEISVSRNQLTSFYVFLN